MIALVTSCRTRVAAAFAVRTAAVSVMFMGFVVTAAAQSVQTGSIIGQVKDGSGGVVPGVTVTATSPALQVPQVTAVTDAQGDYRLTPLPIGSYTITYELQGFRTLRFENVQLTAGFVARLDQALELGTLEDAITVSGAAPVVDVTSAAVRTTLVGEAMMLLPSSQSGTLALLAQVPGVRQNLDVGGTAIGGTQDFYYNGRFGEQWQLIEGILNGRQTNVGSGNKVDYTAIEEVRVQAAGNAAEMPKRGMMMDIVIKSGGNDFHGQALFTNSPPSFQGNNLDDTRRQGILAPQKLVRKRDLAGQIGGRIIRDRLWFFTSVRRLIGDRTILNLYKPDGSPEIAYGDAYYSSEKVSLQLTQQNKFVGFHQVVSEHADGGDQFNPKITGATSPQIYTIAKLEWQSVPATWLVVSLQAGSLRAHTQGGGEPHGPPSTRTFDSFTLMNGGHAVSPYTITRSFINHQRGVATIYAPRLFAGNHEFKIGFDNTIDAGKFVRGDRMLTGNYVLQFNNGVPDQIQVENNPVVQLNKGVYWGGYVQDSWRIGRRLTLNLGVRAAHDNNFIPPQCQAAREFALAFPAQCYDRVQLNIWNSVAPRLHGIYDLTGSGKTLIKGGWGRYPMKREVQGYQVTSVNPAKAATYFYRWRDLNGNKAYDPGEVNLDPQGPDWLRGGNLGEAQGGTVSGVKLNPNELQPYSNEFTVDFEHEVARNMGVRFSTTHTRNHHIYRQLTPSVPYSAYSIPISNLDPGPDGVLGNADDTGNRITYYEYPAALSGARFNESLFVNDDPTNDTNFTTLEMGLTRRLANNWQLNVSHVRTKVNLPFAGVPTTLRSLESGALALNPNAELFAARNYWEWINKVNGSYRFWRGILASFNYELRSGDKLTRTVQFRGGTTIPSIVLPVAPVGSITLPNLSLLDLRVAKQFMFSHGQRLEVYLDMFNTLNVNTTVGMTTRAGPSFMVPTSVVSPRIVGFGLRYNF
jgi:hypothetical protein